MAPVLNLNNEVVKMRKDVKKARVLTIRRLTRHIGKLKLKKGSEDLKIKNQKRVERLIEEIHAMKSDCTATERAIARLATHPILKPKFIELKAAVKAFKDARKNSAKETSLKNVKSEEQPKSIQQFNSNLDDQALKLAQKQKGCEHKTKTNVKIEADKVAEELCKSKSGHKTVEMKRACGPEESSFQVVKMQAVTQNKTGKKPSYQKRKENMTMNKLNALKEIIVDSDLEQPNEEEYFDDSTEERFYNQSSDSDSDSNDDFFIGKVKKNKKPSAVSDVSSTKEKDTLQENIVKKEKDIVPGIAQDLIRKEGEPQEKASKLKSVFCSSLSNSNQKSQNRRNTKDQPPKNGRTALLKKELQLKKQPFAKAAGMKYNNKKACSEQPLHPSWEASRRRREQMSQITAFQGKKIKFDD
ncbi:serum response factor-binding protein 1 isoform X3 [Cuculus canorus]|uniref:serum response factor-binding protein 1 isoform X3 n=1 Tax=Cuculus canorus TaxID=55661 RepID=UPI0023AAE5BC|nr:serum response factor-binding protein 1 isoform X3 [Cuculus canorus]